MTETEYNRCPSLKARRGITLVELLVTISIIGILVFALAFSYQNWVAGYKVESQIKQIHSDLLYARTRAMARSRTHFFTFPSTTSYTIYEDTNPGPDGDDTLQTAGDTQLAGYPKTSLQYPVTWGGGTISFDRRGLITPNTGTISVNVTDDNADYDCIILSDLKINLGKMNGGNCIEK